MAISVVQRYEQIIRVIRICSMYVGTDVLKPTWKMNPLTWTVIIFINMFVILTCYTVYFNIYVVGQWSLSLQALTMLGSGLHGYAKLLNAIWNREYFRFLVDDLHLIYKEYNAKPNSDYRTFLNRTMNRTVFGMKSMAIVYVIVIFSLISVVPLYRFVFNQRIFIMQFLIPGLDPTSNERDFIIMNVIHFASMLFGGFGNFAADLCFFLLVFHVPLYKDILQCKFHEVNEALANDEMERSSELLNEIFLWHQRYMKYISTVKINYFYVILIEMATIALCMALSLFCIILGTWPGGQTYFIYCFIMIYVFCGLGTLVDATNDGFIESCYNEIIWYRLSIKDRRMLQMMLMMTQNTSGLTVGAVKPLTVNTGLQLTKAIYTMTMMLINFLD
ncbi:odorant receptor 67d-like [Musca vetustissima]|uniref:odorant receptor 67d-like n=1 Tax=Musca vetustissima TaxID=27455 RepID=UPI002AB702C4|nr:odorant receptor 67d-like [Musca vetustissima]